MFDCIHSAYCIASYCDRSCPSLAESTYLLDRNGLDMRNPVFQAKDSSITSAMRILKQCENKLGVWVSSGNPEGTADLLTYCAVCEYGKGSRLHCSVYHLNYFNYIDSIKESWKLSQKPQSLEYTEIWCSNAKVLIVSGFRYMKFSDFECQTLLKLIDSRCSRSQTTLIVSPELNSLVGASADFLPRLKSELGRAVIK